MSRKIRIKRPYLDKVIAFKEISAPHSLSESYKLFILQVYSGIKRAGSFDGLAKKDREIITGVISLLKALELHYKLLDLGRNIKILFSAGRETVLGLAALHDGLFEKYLGADKYGKLLGYPSCCISRFLAAKKALDPYFYCARTLPPRRVVRLDHRLNRFCGYNVISHFPCSQDCPKTLEMVNDLLAAYAVYDPILVGEVIAVLKKPVLAFKENNYIKFTGSLKNNAIVYSSIEHADPSFFERGEIDIQDECVRTVAGIIRRGDRIVFQDGRFLVFSGDALLLENYPDSQPYWLYNFK